MEIRNFLKKKDMILFVFIYIALSFWLKEIANDNTMIHVLSLMIEASTVRGIITQLQMLVSIYLVLAENRTGYILSILLNVYSMMIALIFLVHTSSHTSIPGVISYFSVILIVTLVTRYKKKAASNILKIEKQKEKLEESEQKLHHLAFYDELTELPNKTLFINGLEQTIHLAKGKESLIGVMFIDLDSFKTINDTMGHSLGDVVLKQVAERFSLSLRKEDTLSRFGGDEFLIQIANIEKVEELYEVSDKIMDIFQQPIYVEEVEFFVTASVGVAVYPVDGEDTESLIKNADIAMYSAKAQGKNQCVFCSPTLKNDIIRKLKLTNKLYRALERNELFIHYQPQIKVETQEIVGFEALLRWNNAEYGMISPNVFIPLAEATGMIKPIGIWVFRTACEQCKRCREGLHKEYRIAINLSLEQLKDASFTEEISIILNETNAVAKNIQIEITETIAFNEEPYVLQRIQKLKNLGMTISIDDFGTGHSSLSRLRTFPIDLIKIDIEFVRGISTNSKKEKEIIKIIILLAKNLGIDVLAEGVETEEEFLFLKEEKCDEIQGLYFYKPMIPDDIIEIITPKTSNFPM